MPDSPSREPPREASDAVQFEVETTAPLSDTSPWRRIWRAGGVADRPLTVRQKFWRGAGLALTLALLAALLFGQQIRTFAAGAWAAAFPPPFSAAKTCLVDGAWSPSGSQLAILGYPGDCGASGRRGGALSLYDSAGRLRRRQIMLDPLLAPAEKTLARAVNTDRIALGQLLWLSGGKRLAVTFTLPPRSDIGETTTQFGILTLDPVSADAHPLVRFYEIPNLPGSSNPRPDTGVIWDFLTDRATVLSGALAFEFWNNPLPLAYQYAWTGADELAPNVVIGEEQARQAPGTPQGGGEFQFWQSGTLTALRQSELPYAAGDAQAIFQTTFAAASPDGRFVLAPVTLRSPVSPRAVGANPRLPGADGAPPILLARDAALARLVRQVGQNAQEQGQGQGQGQRQSAGASGIALAWRPDGAALATLDNGQTLRIYNCVTGLLLRSVAAPAQPAPFQGALGTLRWSPDGRHLLLPNGAVLAL